MNIKNKYGIVSENAWVVSTHHVPHANAFTEFCSSNPRYCEHQFGWIVFLSKEDERPCPDWLRNLMVAAVKEDVSFLIFDRDGQVIDDLPFYNW